MPISFCCMLALVGADPDRPEVVVAESASGTAIPVASAGRPMVSHDVASSPRAATPTVKREHERQLQKLHVQRALYEARRSLDQDDAAAAIKVLEEHLASAGGAEDYLDLLDAAYRRQLATLVKLDRAEEAALLEERRKILASRTAAPAPAPTAVKEERPAPAAEAPAPAPVKPAAKGNGIGGALFGQLFGKKAPAKPEPDDKVVVRARWDHRNDSANEAEPKAERSIPAARTEEPALAPEAPSADVASLKLAEKLWKERNYLQALVHYQAAYQANPSGPVQDARDRFGYCLLWATYFKYEPKTADAAAPADDRSFSEWEADVKQGRQLCRIESFRKFADEQLTLLEKRRQSRYRPAAMPNAAVNAPVANAAVPSKPTAAPANVSYRHLPQHRAGGWQITETENFRIIHRDVALAEEVAVIAETARKQAHDLWFAAEPVESWANTKCDLVLYPSGREFAQQTNQMPNSPAFTQCDVHNGFVASRRIELNVEAPNVKNGILPHEIAHAVFAGRFAGRSPPKWADEGMAVLTEPEEIQNRHLTGLVQARGQGRGFTCDQLLPMQSYPQQVQEFYAHSVGVCRMLVERHGGRERLVQFVRTATETNDYENALFRIYQIRGLRDLETRFQQYVGELRTNGAVAAR